MLNELGWKNLEERRRETRLTLLFKLTHNEINIPTEGIITPLANLHGTRLQTMQNKFSLITSTIDSHRYSFFPRTIRDWNELPTSTASCSTIETFKRELKAGANTP